MCNGMVLRDVIILSCVMVEVSGGMVLRGWDGVEVCGGMVLRCVVGWCGGEGWGAIEVCGGMVLRCVAVRGGVLLRCVVGWC